MTTHFRKQQSLVAGAEREQVSMLQYDMAVQDTVIIVVVRVMVHDL